MTVLVDSDVLIELSRGRNPQISAQWESAIESDAVLVCSAVTVAELWRGVRPRETADLEDIFSSLTCLPVDAVVGRLAGDILREHGPRHGVEIADALIGATAIANDAKLWTRNHRHYPSTAQQFYTPPAEPLQ